VHDYKTVCLTELTDPINCSLIFSNLQLFSQARAAKKLANKEKADEEKARNQENLEQTKK